MSYHQDTMHLMAILHHDVRCGVHMCRCLLRAHECMLQCGSACCAPGMQFEGGVICISHDSQLLSRVCDDAERSEVWLVEDGHVQRYDGYFEDYKDELVKEIAADMEED